MKRKILLVEDDPMTRISLRRLLAAKGYSVLESCSGSEGLRIARSSKPDLVIADWVLGTGLQGVDLCVRLKRDPGTRAIPILIVTGAREEFGDRLIALEKGADLYLIKDEIVGGPERRSCFLAYVRALLHRPFQASDYRRGFLRRQGLEIDLRRHAVRTRHELISDLSTKGFDLLYILAKKYPAAVSRKYLVRAIWKSRVRDREVDVAICRLKARLERGKDRILESVLGKGYRLALPPSITGTSNEEPS